jgi:hypothetical protein
MVTLNDGKNIGYELVSTSLAGSWQGNSRSLFINAPAVPGDRDSGRTVIEAGHGQMWFFLQNNGIFTAYADGCRDGGKIIRGSKFEGRIFKMTDYAFALVNGGHLADKSSWSSSYYPVILNGARDQSTIFTMDTSAAFTDCEACRDYGRLFVEQQWFGKISDEIDLEIMRGIRAISDQWLWQPQDEDGPFGEQYPPDCGAVDATVTAPCVDS